MKRIFRMALGVMAMAAIAACGEVDPELPQDEVRILTFEDSDYKGAATDYWSSKIDSQYGGPLIYSPAEYSWYDEGNTFLAQKSEKADWTEYGMGWGWACGHAISNYTVASPSEASYLTQLAVVGEPGKGGFGGSKNFAVHYGYDEFGYNPLPSLYFGDGVERVIVSMYVKNTAYGLSSASGFVAGDMVKITATGYDKADKVTGASVFFLFNGPGTLVSDWKEWDLSTLGHVARVEFNVGGSGSHVSNDYGFSFPAYFAYDNVAVLIENTLQ